jgi:hypothetical protein
MVIRNDCADCLGSNVRSFIEATNVQTTVSSSSQCFPGLDLRVVQLTSPSLGRLINAAAVIWEVVCLSCTNEDISRNKVTWEPTGRPSHEFDQVEVTVRRGA